MATWWSNFLPPRQNLFLQYDDMVLQQQNEQQKLVVLVVGRGLVYFRDSITFNTRVFLISFKLIFGPNNNIS